MMPADWRDSLRSLMPESYSPEPDADRQEQSAAAPLPRLKVELDRKRAGKTATIVSGFDPADERCAELAAELRRTMACGGSARGGEILLQGDRVDAVRRILKEKGYK